MSEAEIQFDLLIMDPDRVIFEGKVSSLFVKGDTGEFEILPFHYPVLSLLTLGDIIVNWKYKLSVKKGILRFFMNQCVIIVELNDET
jgi:F0F1-type ATP synthase epsilon subunit